MSAINSNVAELKPDDGLKVQRFLEDLIVRSKVPGISVAMDVNGASLVVAAGVSDVHTSHPMTPELHFEVGGLNQLLTALVVLRLVVDGKVELDRKISHFLPELKGNNGDRIEVRHLLSHTAGYQEENLSDPDVQQDFSYTEFLATFNQRPLHFQPGTVFDYSYSSSVLLAKIAGKVTGRELGELVKELVFNPLGIRVLKEEHSRSARCVRGHRPNPETRQFSNTFSIEFCEFWRGALGGPWITMRDLVKIGRALVAESGVFSGDLKRLLLSSEISLPGLHVGSKAEQPFFVFGLGCARFPNGSYGVRSSWSGQCCALRFDPATGIVIAAALNVEAPYLRDFCINKLFNAMLPEDAAVKPELFPSPDTRLTPQDIDGAYKGAKHHEFHIRKEEGKIIISIGHNPAISSDGISLQLDVTSDEEGNISIAGTPELVALSFFKDPVTEKLNLMIGCNAYVHA